MISHTLKITLTRFFAQMSGPYPLGCAFDQVKEDNLIEEYQSFKVKDPKSSTEALVSALAKVKIDLKVKQLYKKAKNGDFDELGMDLEDKKKEVEKVKDYIKTRSVTRVELAKQEYEKHLKVIAEEEVVAMGSVLSAEYYMGFISKVSTNGEVERAKSEEPIQRKKSKKDAEDDAEYIPDPRKTKRKQSKKHAQAKEEGGSESKVNLTNIYCDHPVHID